MLMALAMLMARVTLMAMGMRMTRVRRRTLVMLMARVMLMAPAVPMTLVMRMAMVMLMALVMTGRLARRQLAVVLAAMTVRPLARPRAMVPTIRQTTATTTAVTIRRGELVPAELVKMGRTLLVGLRTLMAARKRH
jgi:hypothetical protein